MTAIVPPTPIRNELMVCLTHVAPGTIVGVLPESVTLAGDKQLGVPLDEVKGGSRYRRLDVGVWIHLVVNEFEISRSDLSNGLFVIGTNSSQSMSRKPVVIQRLPSSSLQNRIPTHESVGYDQYVSIDAQYLVRGEIRSLGQQGTIQFAQETIKLTYFDPIATHLSATTVTRDDLVVSTNASERWVKIVNTKQETRLSALEWKILLVLINKPGNEWVYYEEIIEGVWDIKPEHQSHAEISNLHNRVSDLGARLNSIDGKHEYIENNRRGHAYRFNRQSR